jgi:plastocyanin
MRPLTGRRVAVLLAAAAAVTLVAVLAAGVMARTTKPKVVQVKDDFYSPVKVKIKKGHKVKWQWGDDFDTHNVTLKTAPTGVKKSKFRSQTTGSPTYHFTRKFTKPGKYHFYCTIHPFDMTMNVVVRR